MWNNYYDKATYKKQNGIDESGSLKYEAPKEISLRQVSGGETYVVSDEDVSRKYSREYQIPFMVQEGDLIDDRVVKSVEPSKDVFGRFHFCIAKVE